MADIFELASRNKFRYSTPQGTISHEDLWSLPLKSTVGNKADLNGIAIELNRQIKEAGEESFVDDAKGADPLLRAKFDIVLHVISVKKTEAEAARLKKENADKKAKILELIAEKQDDALKGKSVEELLALANTL